MMDERYERQLAIPGWDQAALTAAHVAIIGSGHLAGFAALGLAALGVGTVSILDDRPVTPAEAGFPFLDGVDSELAATALARAINRVNPGVQAYGAPLRLLYDALATAIPACDLLIDVTADSGSKQICLAHGRQLGVPVVLAAADVHGGMCYASDAVTWLDPALLERFDGLAQGALPSQIVAGLALTEARRLLMPLPINRPPNGPLVIDLNHPARFGMAEIRPRAARFGGVPGHALIVGAGALGTWAGLALALRGVRQMTIVDPDVVETSNLNRQVLFYDAVGQPKATILAARLAALCPGLDARGVIAPVNEAHLDGTDLILSCVDSFATRAWLNERVRVRAGRGASVVLVNGGTGPFQGDVVLYQPGVTACLACQFDVERLAAVEAGRRNSCAAVPEPSVVITNMLVGGWMAAEALRVFEDGRPPLRGVLAYDAAAAARFGTRSPRAACRCHERVPA